MGAEARLAELNLTLPPAPKPVATYLTAVRHGDLLYVSGHGPLRPDGTLHLGKLGADLDLDGRARRRPADRPGDPGDRPVATSGSLDKVVRLVKVLGMVNSTPDFADHPKVINGFSDLMVEVFGEPGKAARSAVGMAAAAGRDRRRDRGDLRGQGLSRAFGDSRRLEGPDLAGASCRAGSAADRRPGRCSTSRCRSGGCPGTSPSGSGRPTGRCWWSSPSSRGCGRWRGRRRNRRRPA